MDFTLSPDQELLRDTARRLLGDQCPPALVRAHIEDRSAASGLWPRLADWTELGAGPLVDLCLFLEETGAVCAPGPFLATTLLFDPLVAGRVGSGGGTGTVAVAGASGHWQLNAEPVKTFVIDADLVDEVAFLVDAGGVAGLAVAERAGLSLRPVETLDTSRPVFEVTVPDDLDVTTLDDAGTVPAWLERCWVGLAAEMLGTARWLFEASLDYAKERVQFAKPIGSFQAIQHKLANMALARERAWAAVYYAAMTVDAGDRDARRAAHVAKASAGEAVRLCAKDAIQIHGGIGFTYEHDLHLWMRRAFASEHLLGTVDWHYDRLADLVLA